MSLIGVVLNEGGDYGLDGLLDVVGQGVTVLDHVGQFCDAFAPAGHTFGHTSWIVTP